MKTKRNALSTLAVFLITVSIVLTSSSCFTNDLAGHKHSYTAKVIEATCLSDGCTEYTCSCGDSYRENETGKGPHRNTTTYEYPTVDKAGKKTSVCSICGHTETVTLDAMSVSSPKIAEFVTALIGSVEYSLSVEETASFTYTLVSDNEAEYPGTTNTITFEVLDAAISGVDGELEGHLSLAINVAEGSADSSSDSSVALDLVVNGDNVYISATNVDGETATQEGSLNDVFYSLLASMMGVSSDDAIEIYYVFEQIAKCAPIVESLVGSIVEQIPEISEDFTNKIVEALELVNEDILVETENADGSITYKVDLAALNHILDLVDENQSLESYLADLFGDKYVDDVLAFIESIPDRTVREISEFVIDAAEAADASISDLYYVVDLFVYMSSGQKISIEKEIYDRYNMTVAELLVEVGEVEAEEKDEFISSMRESLATIVEAVKTTTVGDFIDSVVEYDSTESGLSFIETLKSVVDQLPELLVLEFTIDVDGQLVALNGDFAQGEFTVDLSVDGGVTDIAVTLSNGLEFALVYSDDMAELEIKQDGEAIVTGALVIGDETQLTLTFPDGIEFVAIYSDNQAELVVKENGVVILTGMLIVDEVVDGENAFTFISATIGDEDVTLSAGVQFVTTEDGTTGYAMEIQGCEGENVMFDFLYSTTYGENFVTYNIYAESEGEIIVAVDAGLELIESEDETEYRLMLDIGKLPVGSTPVYEDVYETDDEGYIVSWDQELVATKTGYLSGSIIITFGCKQ
ncbi:MAG: hypothetical protein IKA67_01785 [Clostridia bacterium]|nr:hypothetical protein [Clostridia bacterium]